MGLPNLAPVYDAGKLQTLVNACQTAANTMHGSVSTFVGTGCYLDQVTGAQIGVLGRYEPAGQLTVVSPNTPTNGAGAGGPLPWNTALVTSLRTTIPRGPGSNGRMYWPCLAIAIDSSTGRAQATSVNTRLGMFKTFLDAVNTAGNAYSSGMKVVVASNKGGGQLAVVTSIRADERLDSIERRENQLPPVWKTANLA